MIRGAGRVRRATDANETLDSVYIASIKTHGLYPLPPDPDRALPGRVMDGRQLLAPVAAR
jgi:hypothetical protein